MDKKTVTKLTHSFNDIAHQVQDEKTEFWYAREIMTILGYDRWENFSKVIHKASIACETSGGEVANHFRGVTKMVLPVIEKAMKACVNSRQPLENHFVEMHGMVSIGSGAERKMDSCGLFRYA